LPIGKAAVFNYKVIKAKRRVKKISCLRKRGKEKNAVFTEQFSDGGDIDGAPVGGRGGSCGGAGKRNV
jgi:hypothetical protein